MKYLLRNIAQSNIPRAVVSIVLGVIFWVCTCVQTDALSSCLLSCGLSIVNAVLLALLYSRWGLTNLPSFFVASTYWLVMAFLSRLCMCWYAQLLVLAVLIALVIMARVGHRYDSMVEESFLASLVVGAMSIIVLQSIIALPIIWGYLLIKRVGNIRSFLSSLIALCIVALYATICVYLGWMSIPWMRVNAVVWSDENLWITSALALVVGVITYLPIRLNSTVNGVIYLLILALSCCAGVVSYLVVL